MVSQNILLTCSGVELNTNPECFGTLSDSSNLAGNGEALRESMESNGYLYLPGTLNSDEVLEVRTQALEKLSAEGLLDPHHPIEEGIVAPGVKLGFRPDLVKDMEAIHRVLYRGPIMELMERFLGEPVLHFDYTWFRTKSKGMGTPPHCDIVYMGRGTKQLYTAWVPYGKISLDIGGLMLLEDSHHKADQLQKYLEMDVDTYCVNREFGEKNDPSGWRFDGSLTKNARNLQKRLGGRWLTSEYVPGDVLIFSMQTIHAGLDNQTDQLRLSSDSRYQRVSEPADHRWIGPDPIAHGAAGKRGLIC